MDGALLTGHTATVLITGSRTDAGDSENTFTVTITSLARADVTKNYDIEYDFGTLTVQKRALVYASENASKIYDGTPLSNSNATRVSGELVIGHEASIRNTSEITDVGRVDNVFAVSIYNGNLDVTSNYDIQYQPGVLTVNPIELFYTSNNEDKVYDGTALLGQTAALLGGTLLDGHRATITMTGSQTDVGMSENTFEIVILDADENPVTQNYDVHVTAGRLTVHPIRITIATSDATAEYSDTPLTSHVYNVVSQTTLLDGHSFEIVKFSDSATITNVGTVENVISEVKITDGERDVTFNYEIECLFGTLSITPRPITIRTGSASKTYDGAPLTCDTWEIVSITQPLAHHTVQVAVSGTRTEVGESKNEVAEIIITDNEGIKVNSNYEIVFQYGALVVKGAVSGSGGGSGDSGDSGDFGDSGGGSGDSGDSGGSMLDTSGNISGGGMNDKNQDESVVMRLRSEKSGSVYLRLTSFGDYTGQKWLTANSYPEALQDKYAYTYLSGIAMGNAGYESILIEIDSKMGQYFIPYFPDLAEHSYVIQSNDVTYTGDGSSEYSLYYYQYDGYGSDLVGNLGEFSDEELLYREFVWQNYRKIDDTTLAFMNEIIAREGFSSTDPDIIQKVATYIQGSATYNLEYDRSLDSESNIVIAFLKEYQEGICQHYASAATMLYRALGIPARYTAGFAGSTSAGQWTEIKGKMAHAWTEVYINGVGWIPVEVTGGGPGGGSGGGSGGLEDESGSGDGSGENTKFTVRPENLYMQYDGVTTLTPTNQIRGISELLAKGYTYDVVIGGSQRVPGISESWIESFVLYDAKGKDVTDQFDITFGKGKLQVYLQELSVSTGSATKTYDGTALTAPSYQLEGTLLAGHRIQTLECTGSLINAGKIVNTFRLVIVDENDNDVTDVYKVNRIYGILQVDARSIHITASSDSKAYDGTALTNESYEMLGTLADGQTIQVVIQGSQTEIGRSENTVQSITVKDSSGKDVTANYIITYQNGVLKVTLN